MANILVASPYIKESSELCRYFEEKNYGVSFFSNGKDAQAKLASSQFLAAVIDLELTNNSGAEVIRFIHSKTHGLKIILIINDKDLLEKLETSEAELKKLGAHSIVINPSHQEVLSAIEGGNIFSSWKEIKVNENSEASSSEQSVTIDDQEFSKVPIDDFFSGNTTIFDLYIRLSANKYVLILKRGDHFDQNRLAKYKDEKGVGHLYFKTSDRAIYINFINEFLKKMIGFKNISSKVKLGLLNTAVHKYVEEVYTVGLKPQILEEGSKLTENLYQTIKRDQKLWQSLKELINFDPSMESHIFMVTMFSYMICNGLKWHSPATLEKVGMGSMFHDIGKMKLPTDIRDKKESMLSNEDLLEYQKHPVYGAELLEQFKISSEIRLIVEQHHEKMDGTGYPKKLSGIRIFPLAKVVSFSNDLVDLMLKDQLQPLQVAKKIANNKEMLRHYDPEVFQALIDSFKSMSQKKN